MTSRRSVPLPPNWDTELRPYVLDRDGYRCKIKGPRCEGRANEVDHKDDPADHRPANLQAACPTCHASKTGRQARARQPNRRRPPEPHPGLINT